MHVHIIPYIYIVYISTDIFAIHYPNYPFYMCSRATQRKTTLAPANCVPQPNSANCQSAWPPPLLVACAFYGPRFDPCVLRPALSSSSLLRTDTASSSQHKKNITHIAHTLELRYFSATYFVSLICPSPLRLDGDDGDGDDGGDGNGSSQTRTTNKHIPVGIYVVHSNPSDAALVRLPYTYYTYTHLSA